MRNTHKWDGLPTTYPLPTHTHEVLTQVHSHKHKPHGLRRPLTPQPHHRRNNK